MFYHICASMSTDYHLFHHQGAVLGYSQAGSGPKSILIFHGFGQDHAVFNALAGKLSDIFTLYSFDLFFHGKSEWPLDETPLSKAYWKELLDQFLTKNSIEKFNLIGFSLGGKFALASLEAFPSRVSSVYLLAPDGIKTNFWYSLATYPLVLRRLFKSMILKPGRFVSIVKWAKKLNLMDKGVIKFAESQMDTEEKRKRVYYSWVVFKQLRFDLDFIASIINVNKIELSIFIGRFDKVITADIVAPLLKRVPHHQLQILETGHNGLIDKSIEALRNISIKSP